MAVQRHPDTRIWFVKSDGEIAVLTYEPKDSVVGWSNVDIGGVVEEVCSLPSGEADDIYVVVRRTIDGSTVRYIERLASRQFDSIEDAFFVDCGLSYDGWNTGSPSGGFGQGIPVVKQHCKFDDANHEREKNRRYQDELQRDETFLSRLHRTMDCVEDADSTRGLGSAGPIRIRKGLLKL